MRKPTGLLDAETCRATKAPFGGRENCHVPAHVHATLINGFSGLSPVAGAARGHNFEIP